MINTAINLSIRTRCYVQSENIHAVILRRDAHNNYWWLVISVSKLRSTSSFRLVVGLGDRFTILQRRGLPSNKTSHSSKNFFNTQKNPSSLNNRHIALHGFPIPTTIESLRRYTPNNLFRNIATVMIEYPITAIKVSFMFYRNLFESYGKFSLTEISIEKKNYVCYVSSKIGFSLSSFLSPPLSLSLILPF